MSIEKENRYHNISLNLSSDKYDKSDNNDPTIIPTKKRDSPVWQYFNVDNPKPVCKNEQQEQDDLVVKWVVCDLQLFNVVENDEWWNMISKFDPMYRFPIWWQGKQHEYPRLSLIVKNYLYIQATSVSSEQAFSIAGQTITASRNRLD
ncbi:23837_t:CDS:2, partial [Gigaspora margarita]